MPAKGKKKKKDTEGTDPIEDAEEAERKEMCSKAKALSKTIEREVADFNEFQQQREKLNYFWIVKKKKLEDKKAELRNKEREKQDLEEKFQVEIKIYKQRLKHLLHEFQDSLTQQQTEGEKALKIQQDENRGLEAEYKADRRSLHSTKKQVELAHESFLWNLKHGQDRNITKLRKEYERKASEIQRAFNNKMECTRAELEEKRRKDTIAIEQQKNQHIATLMDAHKKAFSEIKNYYNDITHNNLDLIKSLKEEVSEMRTKEQQDEKQMESISQENKRMSEPFKRAKKDVEILRTELDRYGWEKEELRRTKAKLLVLEDEYRKLKWEHEVCSLRYSEVERQKNDLKDRFEAAVFETQQKSGFKNLILTKKHQSVQEELEVKEAQLNEVIARANLDGSMPIKKKVADLLQRKNQEVLDLQTELERTKRAQRQLHQDARSKLAEYGVPVEELGFAPAT